MTKNQEHIINICRIKNKAINKCLNAKRCGYFTKKDEQDILQWTNEECNAVLKLISMSHFSSDNLNDNSICPWCIINYNINKINNTMIFCETCTYGKRHGVCGTSVYDMPNNTYGKIINKLKKKKIFAIIKIPGLLNSIQLYLKNNDLDNFYNT